MPKDGWHQRNCDEAIDEEDDRDFAERLSAHVSQAAVCPNVLRICFYCDICRHLAPPRRWLDVPPSCHVPAILYPIEA